MQRPAISIPGYVDRIQLYTRCSDCCYILGFIYIDRVLQKNHSFQIRLSNVHRLLLAAIVVAIKFYDDTYYDNWFYAQVGGISLQEFNLLERKLLSLLSFDLHVYPEQYSLYLAQISTKAAQLNAAFIEPMVADETKGDTKPHPAMENMGSFATSPSNDNLAGDQ